MAKVEEKKKPQKEKKERKGLKRKFKEIGSELKKVSWPSFGTVVKNTGIVLAVVAVFLVILLAFDMILTYGVYRPLTSEDALGAVLNLKNAAINLFKTANIFKAGIRWI